MPDRNGYIGRAPSDSAVTVARQTFTPTGVTTDFTFASGYVPGYFDIYINGAKQIEASDYTSTDGSTFSIVGGGVTSGDVIEAVAYKAFNAGTVTGAADLTVSGNLTVNGSATFAGAGTSVAFATTAYNLEGTPDLTVRNLTGVAATFTGVVTYEDVTNVDSVGIITARQGVEFGVSGVGGTITATGQAEFAGVVTTTTLRAESGTFETTLETKTDAAIVIEEEGTIYTKDGDRLRILIEKKSDVINIGQQNTAFTDGIQLKPGASGGQVKLHAGGSSDNVKLETTNDGVVITGIATATNVSIADSIFHTGDTNTAIRFPAADTFTVETAGSERLRVDSNGRTHIGDSSDPQSNLNISASGGQGGGIQINRQTSGSPTDTQSLGSIGFKGVASANSNTAAEALIEATASENHSGSTAATDLLFHTKPTGTGPGSAPTERLRITSTGGVHFSNAELIERVSIVANKLSAVPNVNLDNGMVHYYTTNETTTANPNIITSAGINTNMATGDTMSVTILSKPNNAGYFPRISIDGRLAGITTYWSGGSAPSSAESSGVDVNTYQIIKTADETFDVLANTSNFA